MEENFKMKLMLLWISLISEAFPLPTQSPTDVDKPCCEESSKLVYRGHDSISGINVYVFEFLPQSQEAKDNRFEDTTMKNGLNGERNGESYKDTFIPTNKPASINGRKKKESKTEASTEYSTHRPDYKLDTINRRVDTAQNDIALYEDTGLLSNATEGLQTGLSATREARKTSGHGNGNDYYATEGSALLDIPGYTDTETAKQSPTIDYQGSVNNVSDRFVTQQTTHKDHSKRVRHGPDGFGNSEGNTKNRKVTRRIIPTNTEKHKSEKKTGQNANTRDIPTKINTRKIFKYHRGQRRKMCVKRHYHSRQSSSESISESSEEFD